MGYGAPWERGWGGPWPARGRQGPPGPVGRPGAPGPPPWLAGLFGLGQEEPRRGPRVRRGDVRSAILDVLRAAGDAGEPVNGYQVITQIEERSGGAWRPSPGSVYPTIAQLEDEGLVETDDERGRRALRLTTAGWSYVADHAAELTEVWESFDGRGTPPTAPGGADGTSGTDEEQPDVRAEIGRVMSAVWQILTHGTERQRREAVSILVDARRRLYGLLADESDHPDEGGAEEARP